MAANTDLPISPHINQAETKLQQPQVQVSKGQKVKDIVFETVLFNHTQPSLFEFSKNEKFHISLSLLRDDEIKFWQNLSADMTLKDILAKLTPEQSLNRLMPQVIPTKKTTST